MLLEHLLPFPSLSQEVGNQVWTCRGLWRIEREKLDFGIGVTSILSFNQTSLAARLVTERTNSNDEFPTASSTGVYGRILIDPLLGEAIGIKEPSEIGTSAVSGCKTLRRGGSGLLTFLFLAFLSQLGWSCRAIAFSL